MPRTLDDLIDDLQELKRRGVSGLARVEMRCSGKVPEPDRTRTGLETVDVNADLDCVDYAGTVLLKDERR